MIPRRAEAWNDATQITLKETANLVDGATENDTAFATDTQIRTEGGYLYDDVETPLLASIETPHRYQSAESAVEKYLKTEALKFSTYIQETDAQGDAHIRANGNLAYPVESGRIRRYPVDWVVDADNAKLYYLLSHPSDLIADALICQDLETETHQVLYRFASEVKALKLSTSDFDTFTILLTDANGFDWSAETLEVRRHIKAAYDASLSENTQIVSYQQSERRYQTVIGKNTDYRPLSALHYWTGVSGQDFGWLGISEGDRGTFAYQDNDLRYRWAKDTEFGVAELASDGTLTALFTETKDAYFNHLNFAFDSVGDDTYFAYVSGTASDSTITIKKRSGGTITTVFSRTRTFNRLNDLDETGNAWLGVQELLVDGDDFYMVVPVSRNGREIATGAGVILYRYSLVTQQLTALMKKDFVQHGVCMLTKFDDTVYFAESPAVTNEYAAKNRDIAYSASEAKGFCIASTQQALRRRSGISILRTERI